MKMITLFLPEKYLEMLDHLVTSNLYPNRSEALRVATWKFISESVSLLKGFERSSSETPSSDLSILDEVMGEIEKERVEA